MKRIILPLLLLSSAVCFAQTHPFHFGIQLTPGYSDNYLTNNGDVPEIIEDDFRQLEIGQAAGNSLIFAGYDLSSRFSLELGLGYSFTGFRDKKQISIPAVPDPAFPKATQFRFNYHDLIMPLRARYRFTPGTEGWYVHAGICPVYKLKRTKVFWQQKQDNTTSTSSQEDTAADYRTLNLNGSIGFGYEFALSEKLHFFVQPVLECNILGVVGQTPGLNRRIYTAGLGVGLRI